MIMAKQWARIVQSNAILLGPKHRLPPRLCPRVPARPKSLSAIHRGLRRTSSASEFKRDFKKRESTEEEESGRPTRRKRFHDPDSKFGKKSLVYRLKFGDLKDEAQSLLPEGDSGSQQSEPWRKHRRPYGRRGSGDSGDSYPRGAESTAHSQRARQGSPAARSQEKFGYFESQNEESPPPRSHSWRVREPREAHARHFESDTLSRRNRRSQPRYGSPGNAEERGDEGDLDGKMDRSSGTEDYSKTGTARRLASSIHFSSAASQFLYGADVVASALREPKRKLYHLYISSEARKRMARIIDLAQEQKIRVTIPPVQDSFLLDRLSKGRPHSGVVLEASPLPQPPIASLGHVSARTRTSRQAFHFTTQWQSKEDEVINGKATRWVAHTWDDRKPLVLLLHQILDPGNVGNLLRTARFLGVNAVGLTKHASAEITPVVLRAAAGAVDEMNVFSVASTVDFLNESRNAGWSAYAAVPPAKHDYFEQDMVTTDNLARNDPLSHDPCILVLGNEGFGLPRAVIEACDKKVAIWRFVESRVTSLNVATAGALLIEAFMRQSTNASLKSMQHIKLKDLRNTMRRDIQEETTIPAAEEEQEAASERMW